MSSTLDWRVGLSFRGREGVLDTLLNWQLDYYKIAEKELKLNEMVFKNPLIIKR